SYAAQGIQCQDCHMTPMPGVKTLTTAATGGPQRPMVFTHQFVGGNATSLASPDHQKLATEQLRGAATVSVVSKTSSWQTGVSIDVIVANTGAGHSLPTGITEVRQMWLETVITDAGGKVIYKSGAVDENGEVDPQAKMYNTEFADAEGNPTAKPWLVASIIRDKRIPPGGSDIQKFNSAVPGDAKMPLTVVVTLHYRSAPPSLVEELLGKNAATLPVIDMASAQATVSLTG
ncbi:MAG: cytochrome c family protein, partial [Thermoleophilia bacterium]